jgi:hypothetical protein
MPESSLSPRALLGCLTPALRLDDEVVGGFKLSDCYRISEHEPVCIELRRASQVFEITIQPIELDTAMLEVAGLGVSYRGDAPVEIGCAACKRVADSLTTVLGGERRRWTVMPPSLLELADAVASEIRSESTTLAGDPDHQLLQRDFDAYHSLYAARPVPLLVFVGDDSPGVSLRYPEPANQYPFGPSPVRETSLRVAHRRRMRRYFAQLGFTFDDQARPTTVPTPTTYTRALSKREGLNPLRPHLVDHVGISPRQWAQLVRGHQLPISIAPRWRVAMHRWLRDHRLPTLRCDVGMVMHDLGLHALALHALPGEAWDELIARARERFIRPAQPWSYARFASFFEGPVTNSCLLAWGEADEPEDFERCLRSHWGGLLDELRGP